MSSHPEHKALSANYYPILTTLVVRDGYRCVCCGKTSGSIVVDHIVSVHHGGKTEMENLQLLCKRCNNQKEAETYDLRPANRGTLGYETPRYTTHGALIIRVSRFGWRRKRFEEAEVIDARATRIDIRFFKDGRVTRCDFRDVYPPDLQHFFPII